MTQAGDGGKPEDKSGNTGADEQPLADLVSQLRDANENLVIATLEAQAMREQAEAVNRRQNEFLAMLAHELRNPLAPLGMAATLLERIADAHPDLPQLQSIVQRQVDHMARLLDDLLDAARVSTGRIQLRKAPVLLSTVIERAVETSLPNVQRRRQILNVALPAQPVVVECDAVRLSQVFSNLLWNASKFTPDQGQIQLAVEVRDEFAVVTVEDNGIGIAEDLLPHIFDLFMQGPRDLARSEGGLGIGLSVARSLVQMHGGTLEAWSRGAGSGSRFTVTLPSSGKAVGETAVQARGVEPGRHLRVLVIEDNADARLTLCELLALEGHHVDEAADGEQGIAAALALPCELIICDIGLPGMNGYEVAKKVRAAGPMPRPTLIAVSGYGQPEDRARAFEAGFDHFFVKPVGASVLLKILTDIVHARDSRPVGSL